MEPAAEFNTDESELRAAENMPAINSPGRPGKFLVTSITKYGTIWSIFFTRPIDMGSQSAYNEYMMRPVKQEQLLMKIKPKTKT